MRLQRDQYTITVDNGRWETTHDLQQGGALTSVVFHKGRHGNLLSRPLAMGIGLYQDIHETRPAVQVRESEGEIALLFSGVLKDASGAGTIQYAQSWKSAELLAGTRPVGVSVDRGKKTRKALMLDNVPPNELWIIKIADFLLIPNSGFFS